MSMTALLIATIALGAGLGVSLALAGIILEGNIGGSAQTRRLSRLLSPVPESASRIAQLARKVEVSRSLLPNFAAQLRWLRLSGNATTEEELVGYSILAAVAGACLGILIFGLPFGPALAGLIGFYAPYYLIKGRAQTLRQRFHRQLPELLQILAAEVAAGASLSVALERLATSASLAGAVFKQLLAKANAHGALWSVNNRPGGLQLAAREWDSPALISLATQLDTLHTQGIEGPETLATLAKSIALRWLGESRMRAENLENELLLPLGLLIFAPFIAAILAPLFIMLINIF